MESEQSTKQLKDSVGTMSIQQEGASTSEARTKSLLDVPDEILKQILDHVGDHQQYLLRTIRN